MTARFRVLVADAISLDGLAPLRDDARFELVNRPGLKGDELTRAIADADAVLVRSATRITRESLAQADRLKVIGRAGVGVDTIDVDAATERGIPVLTAPEGNTISAAELTMALVLALARKVPGADRSMKAGEWDKKSFTGTELCGKTFGLVGAGRIGSEVARRARAFGMRVLVYDPFLNTERALALDVEIATLDEVLEKSDVVSVHVPLTDSTRNLVGEAQIARMKRGVLLLNVARGGVVDEQALLAALQSGHVAGAALDVFETEPLPADHPFRSLRNVVLTPHLGASTSEAQHSVAIEIAGAVRAALVDGDLSRAVNAPSLGGVDVQRVRPILNLAQRLGTLGAAIAGGPLKGVEVRYAGSHPSGLRVIAAAGVAGALTHVSGGAVNVVNATRLAQSRGIRVDQMQLDSAAPYAELVEVRVSADTGQARLVGAMLGEAHERIVRVDDYSVSLSPRGTLLVVHNRDVPQVMGLLGTALAQAGHFVDEYQQARREGGGAVLALIRIDRPAQETVLASLRAVPDVQQVQQVIL
ncbi:MAG TPA: phosphoglycerate dehydrogenase [Gemmatimonadaceae bacterium]